MHRIGTLPYSVTKSAAVALPNGKLMVLGGEGTDRILAGPPSHPRVVGHLPASTHDAAAVVRGPSVLLYGGGEAVSTPAVVRIDSRSAAARALHPLDEPLSDLGAAHVQGSTYLVGGYTGTRYASAILRVGANGRTTTAGRLPAGTRYAGVATSGGKIYVAGGLTTQGESSAIYAFDPRDGSVVSVGSLPSPEAHAALAALGGNLYLFGGTSVLRISPSTGAVARVATLPQPLTDPNAVTIGNRIVVLGGGTNAVYALTARG
jgi:outer membrane protein assembly factor BamB